MQFVRRRQQISRTVNTVCERDSYQGMPSGVQACREEQVESAGFSLCSRDGQAPSVKQALTARLKAASFQGKIESRVFQQTVEPFRIVAFGGIAEQAAEKLRF